MALPAIPSPEPTTSPPPPPPPTPANHATYEQHQRTAFCHHRLPTGLLRTYLFTLLCLPALPLAGGGGREHDHRNVFFFSVYFHRITRNNGKRALAYLTACRPRLAFTRRVAQLTWVGRLFAYPSIDLPERHKDALVDALIMCIFRTMSRRYPSSNKTYNSSQYRFLVKRRS